MIRRSFTLLRFTVSVALLTRGLGAQSTPAAASQVRVVTLPEAIARGRSNGVQGALARLAAQAIDARRGQRGADILPSVTASASATRQSVNLREFGFSIPGAPEVTDPFTVLRARLAVNQLLFDRSTLERLHAARDTALAAGLDADRVGALAGAAAGAAWLRLAATEETVRAREQDSVTATALLQIARDQVDAGTAARIDRTRSEAQLAAVRSRIAVAQHERERARLDLARALDLPTVPGIGVSGEAELLAWDLPTGADAAVEFARAHRVDLVAARQRAVAARRSLSAVRSEFIPSLAASGFVQTSGQELDGLARTWSIGVGLNWPLFDGFRRARRADEQHIRLDAEQLRLHDLEAQIDAEARMAVLDLASARLQITLATERLRLAEQELTEARERFAGGVAGSVETTNAQGELMAARDVLIQARMAAVAAQVSAAKAMGVFDAR